MLFMKIIILSYGDRKLNFNNKILDPHLSRLKLLQMELLQMTPYTNPLRMCTYPPVENLFSAGDKLQDNSFSPVEIQLGCP